MRRKALKAAFPCTIPIFTVFWFLGLAYGIYMKVSGFSFVYPMLMSLLLFGVSLEFVTVEMLLSPLAYVSPEQCSRASCHLPSLMKNEKRPPLCSISEDSCHPLCLGCWSSTACAMSMYCRARTVCRSLFPFL